MTKILITIIAVTILYSCKNKDEKLNNLIIKNTRTYLETELLANEKYERLDNLKFLKRDTITQLDEGLMYADYLSQKVKRNISLAEDFQREAEQYKGISLELFEKAKINAQAQLDSSQILLNVSGRLTRKLAKLDTIKPIYLYTTFYTKFKLKNATSESDTLKVVTDLDGNLLVSREVMNTAKNKYK